MASLLRKLSTIAMCAVLLMVPVASMAQTPTPTPTTTPVTASVAATMSVNTNIGGVSGTGTVNFLMPLVSGGSPSPVVLTSGTLGYLSGNTTVITVRDAGGAANCTITFTGGIVTATTCSHT